MSGALLTAKAAARKLGVSITTLRRLTKGGHVPCFVDPSTGRLRYSEPALDRWLADNCPTPRSNAS